MKINVWYLLAILCVTSVCFSSCGGDDPLEDTGNSNSSTGNNESSDEYVIELTSANLTDKGYFDGILYYQITSNANPKTAEVIGCSDAAQQIVIAHKLRIDGIEYTITAIGERAFYDKKNMFSIIIGNSVTSIGRAAFNGSDLTSIDIPNSVTSIGDYAFEYCNKLTSVTIGNGMTSIGKRVFSGCSGLTSINIPNSVTSIGGGAFSSCSGLTSINIPNSVTSIGGGAFSGCSGLTSINISNSVTSIGDNAFIGCSKLTSVNIGNSVTSIGNEVFNYCHQLKDIYCHAVTPPTIGYYFVYNVSSVKVHVPAASVSAYKNAEGWREFGDNIVPM